MIFFVYTVCFSVYGLLYIFLKTKEHRNITLTGYHTTKALIEENKQGSKNVGQLVCPNQKLLYILCLQNYRS